MTNIALLVIEELSRFMHHEGDLDDGFRYSMGFGEDAYNPRFN
jgi:hypothetical protein